MTREEKEKRLISAAMSALSRRRKPGNSGRKGRKIVCPFPACGCQVESVYTATEFRRHVRIAHDMHWSRVTKARGEIMAASEIVILLASLGD
jgi:hypothetical protein